MADPFLIRVDEGDAPDFSLYPDSVWNAWEGVADHAIAPAGEPFNSGGLLARQTIATAVVLALFTDRRIDPTHPLFFLADGDPRGYWGDGLDVRADLAEQPLGSYLYLLERAPLTILGRPAADWAVQFALEALAPLKVQGVAVRIDAQAVADQLMSRLELTVQLYARDGSTIFNQTFGVFWNQVAA